MIISASEISLPLCLSSVTLKKIALPFSKLPIVSLATSTEKSATVTNQLFTSALSNNYFINVIAERPAPITNIFFIFNLKMLG